MPPLPGEERLVTVFADIHYYFGTPTVRPLLHRFDKASYFYIYYNSTRQTSRIEVANNPGTPEQDAFSGSLDSCRIINSHRFPTLLTLVVDGTSQAPSPTSSRTGRDLEEWRLSSADPRDPGKQKYRIHTLDIYFWAEVDAKLVIETCKHLLHPTQLDVAELKPEPDSAQEKQQDEVHPVVQNLEHVAISDPAYRNGQTRNSQTLAQNLQSVNLPPPPPPPAPQQEHTPLTASSVSPVSALSHSDTMSKPQEAPQSFAPVPYNPAAPPAPEPIAHREDTPPPPDDGTGTGLVAATAHDAAYGGAHPQPWTGVPHTGQHSHYGSPPPPQTFASSPPPSSAPSFGVPLSAVSSGHDSRYPSAAAQHYAPSSPPLSYNHEPVETPGAQFYPHNGQPHKTLQHNQPHYADYLSAVTQGTPPPGGFSQYSYNQLQQPQQVSGYDIHSQVYRPTETEAQAHSHHHRKPSRTDTAAPNKKESRSEKVEKGVGKLFKRIDKKIGLT